MKVMKRTLGVVATLLIAVAACAGAYELWDYYMFSPWTRDARVAADVVTIAPDVAGFVVELRVKDNQTVARGDVLFVLDQDRYKLALATAEAAVAARKAEMQMRLHEADRRARLTTLSTSIEERERAQFAADSAVAAYAQARADLSTARLNLERTVVRAPVNGFITNLMLDVGQYASVGTRLLALINSDSYRVEGYFEETKIPSLIPGQKVRILLMSGVPALTGHVASISRGITDTDNSPGPQLLANVNPTFEWVRLAQRVPVRIQIDHVPAGVLVSSGMTSTVIAETGPRPWAIAGLVRQALSAAQRVLPRLFADTALNAVSPHAPS